MSVYFVSVKHYQRANPNESVVEMTQINNENFLQARQAIIELFAKELGFSEVNLEEWQILSLSKLD